MSKAFLKDMLRCWRRSWKRFASIALITLLGVAVLTGIYAGCRDAFLAAGRFYESQGLHDIQIVSTAGLTDDDVAALRKVRGVESVQAERSRNVTVTVRGSDKTAVIREIGETGGGAAALDRPYLTEGRLPKKTGEIAVTKKFLNDSGLKVGGRFTVDSEEMESTDSIDSTDSAKDSSQSADSTSRSASPRTKLTITGVVIDPRDLANPDGYASKNAFRSTASDDYAFFAPAGGTTGNATNSVTGNAPNSETADTTDSTATAPDDIYTSISLRITGAADLDTFSDGYDTAVRTVADRIETKIQSKREKARRQQLTDAAQAKLDKARAETEQRFADAQARLDQQRAQFDAQVDGLAAQSAGSATQPVESATQPADHSTQPAYDPAVVRQSVIAKSPELQQVQSQLDQAQADLTIQKEAAIQHITDQTIQVTSQIPQVRWYVTTRSDIGGFSAFKSDMTSIESIGRAFPVVFLLVAVLMSLTTMARMVEEDRGLIGTYLGLGYKGIAVASRYLLFALLACLIGGGLGLIAGFLGIPAFLLVVIEGLYTLPGARLEYDWLYGTAGIALFVVGVLAATAFACRRDIRHMPAELMRPKAPKAGARILLERIRPVWRRMGFLNKVTARNIFRFKSRLVMTVGGVAGCTALILCGLAINDTVAAIGPKQYDGIYRYDLMAVSADADAPALRARLDKDGKTTATLRIRVENGELSTAAASPAKSSASSETIQLIVVPERSLKRLNTMIDLREASDSDLYRYSGGMFGRSGGGEVTLDDSGAIVSQSAANALGVHAGDTVTLRGGDLTRAKTRVAAVTRSLVGSDVYVSESLYQRLFGDSGDSDDSADSGTTTDSTGSTGNSTDSKDSAAATPVWNAVYAKLTGDAAAQTAYVDKLADDPAVVSAVGTAELADGFSFDLMGAVVALIVGLAGALCLVVLFTLANTNISERVREMATLKVLGFRRREIHQYVNREMRVLTWMGVAVGLPLGRWIGGLLTAALGMPSLYFEVDLRPTSYLAAAFVTLVFAEFVAWLTKPVLDRIDPVGALKSVE
ncbi:FtsX-like permease family protein [Bifidobacterium stellenboschense]|uniref:ABC transporter n=1 Tax=Bifidobacterium stellenboschense TaxID=762211 RepID=A0A087DIA5_9BIFI|nr:FtsX-like permease family protein [Bifidobacterium stellenboschense]KFI95255.1 ABC transporter [Bifidobacterium stellenboschense]